MEIPFYFLSVGFDGFPDWPVPVITDDGVHQPRPVEGCTVSLGLARGHQAGHAQTVQQPPAVVQDSLELTPLLPLGGHVSVGPCPPHLIGK